MANQENTIQINSRDSVPDGDTDARLFRVPITSAAVIVKIAHGLGRVPTKAYVVESMGQPFSCFTKFKDRDQIHLGFFRSDIGYSLDGGTAVVRIQ